MKRIILLSFTIIFALAVVVFAGDQIRKVATEVAQTTGGQEAKQPAAAAEPGAKAEGKVVTLTGEVVDLHCYMARPAASTGAEHAKCANDCIAKGLPVGFLTADGTLYVIVGNDQAPANPMVKDWLGKQSTISGKLMQHNGVKAIDLASISAAKG